MKKLLVMSLVLVVASLANAAMTGLSMDYAGDKITLSSDQAKLGGLDIAFGVVGPVTLGNINYRTVDAPDSAAEVTYYTGEEATSADFGTNYDGGIVTILWSNKLPANVTTPSPAGFWLSFDLAGYKLGTEASHDVQIDLTDGNLTPYQTLYLSAVPEPATMALLGLGGLFFARKK